MNKTSQSTTAFLIAPCGMNCRLCRAYGRKCQPCPGCRGDDGAKAKTRVQCKIKRCEKLTESGSDFCYSCSDFPCTALLHLDSRYRARYGMSMIENLGRISTVGIEEFVRQENGRWTCRQCGALLCVHKPACCSCGHVWHPKCDR